MSALSVDGALAEARAMGVERLDAQRWLACVLGRERSWLLGHGEEVLDDLAAARFRDGVQRLVESEPLAYLLGEQEFHGLTLRVTPQVLVPRADTEVLVDWALAILAERAAPADVLDLGTGSGAIALAIAHRCPTARLCAVDASDAALAVARANGQRLHLRVEWLQSDWWQAVAGRRFDLVVSNPPYIAAGDPHLGGLTHEPISALTSGGDGLDALRHIAAGANAHLQPGAWLLLEHGYDQGEAVRELLHVQGFVDVTTRLDLAGHPRCTGGRR